MMKKKNIGTQKNHVPNAAPQFSNFSFEGVFAISKILVRKFKTTTLEHFNNKLWEFFFFVLKNSRHRNIFSYLLACCSRRLHWSLSLFKIRKTMPFANYADVVNQNSHRITIKKYFFFSMPKKLNNSLPLPPFPTTALCPSFLKS